MKVFLTLSVYFILMVSAFAQTPAQRSFQAGIEINKADPEDYLSPVNEIEKLAPEDGDQAGFHIWCQAMSTFSSFIGELPNAIGYFDRRYRNDLEELTVDCDSLFFQTHTFRNAREYVLEEAANRSVVMLNEAHHIPYHRAFAFILLGELYNQGFRYLAVEDLLDTTINKTRLLTDTSGAFYMREPMSGEFIREGLKRGFTLIPFDSRESFDGAGRDRYYVNRSRDSVMARNLSKIFVDDPQAKVFVYTGYDHIFEGSKNGWKHIGEFLQDFTGIDPLTISQSQHMEHTEPKLESKEFRAVNSLGRIKEPVVALASDSVFHDPYVDVSIISPRYLDDSRRPDYLSLGGNRKPYVVRDFDYNAAFVQAFYDDGVEKGHRVPADQMVLNKKGNTLFLFPGHYSLEIKDDQGHIISMERIHVL